MRAKLLRLLPELATHQQTKQLHALLITAKLAFDSFITTNVLRAYARSKDLNSARQLFDRSPQRTVFLWNSIIRAYARERYHFFEACSLFNQMRSSFVKPDSYTFASISRGCAENSDLFAARMVHGCVIFSGFGDDVIVGSAVTSSYAKLGLLEDAEKVFDISIKRDLVMWNALMMGYGYLGYGKKGLEHFHYMRESGEKPDVYTFVALISCFRDQHLISIGSGVHGFIVKAGCDSGDHVRSALVSMYSSCRCLDSAYQLFKGINSPDVVTWTSLVTGFSQAGKSWEAISLTSGMIRLGKKLDPILASVVLTACAESANIGHCKEVHSYVIRLGMDLDVQVCCALTNAYIKCGFSQVGLWVFESIQEKNLVAYNTLILGLGSHGLGYKATEVLEDMLLTGLKPDKATFSSLLCACCHSRLEEEGRKLFERMKVEFGLEPEMEHYVYIVKLLGMVGCLEEAYELIQTMPMQPDSGVWGSFLWGCSVHGRIDLGELAVKKLIVLDPQKMAYRVMLSNMYASEYKWGHVENLRDDIVEDELQKVPGVSWVSN